MIEYKVSEVSGGSDALQRELNQQAVFGWKLNSFEVVFAAGYSLKYVVVFEREKK